MAVCANRKPSNGIVTLVSHTDVWYTRVILPPPEVYIGYRIWNTIRSIGVIVGSDVESVVDVQYSTFVHHNNFTFDSPRCSAGGLSRP